MAQAMSGAAHSANGPAAISPTDLNVLATIAADEGGLSISTDKVEFLVARLSGQLTRLGLADFSEYAAHMRRDGTQQDKRLFIEALTTHTTSFFRERPQYDWMRDKALPAMLEEGAGTRRPFEVWSAACSTGAELYSALMLVANLRPKDQSPLLMRGVGTDLSHAILKRGKLGVYTKEEIDGIPVELRRRFLLSSRDGADRYRIGPDLRKQATWTQANLTRAGDVGSISADIAFLRNVLIYFDAETRDRVLRNVIGRISPGGYLLTGHSETIDARSYGLTSIRPSIYHKER
ncbi:MAG: protein-glutamate O-methyltransferase CheR [Pseudomonadota bacterium]